MSVKNEFCGVMLRATTHPLTATRTEFSLHCGRVVKALRSGIVV